MQTRQDRILKRSIAAIVIALCASLIIPSSVSLAGSEGATANIDEPAPVSRLSGFRIGIQAGHGHGDPGALSCDKSVHEADITAAVAEKVVNILQSNGAQVDLFTGQDGGMMGYQADAFVALHTDYCPDPENPSSPSGYKVARNGGTAGTGMVGNGDSSDQLVQALWDEYGRTTGIPQDRSPGHFKSGMLGYYALNEIDPATPGAIIEMGWLSGDLGKLVNQQDTLAAGIANGIMRFLSQGSSQTPASATVLVLDVSGSMAEEWQGGIKMESAKNAAVNVLTMIEQENRSTEANHQIAVASFSDDAWLELALTDDYNSARNAANRLEPTGGTNIGAGLQTANAILTTVPTATQKTVILLSDGLTNQGLSPDQILAGPVQEAAATGTCIYTVGFGDAGDIDEALLRNIAAGSGCGEYQYASAPADLERVYVRLRHESLGTIVGEFEGQIAQGQTADIGQIDVPKNQSELYVTLHWPGSDLDLIVVDPRGREVDPDSSNVSMESYERLVYMIVQDPLAGMWMLKAVGVDVPEGVLTYDSVASVRERVGPAPSHNSGAILLALGLTLVLAGGIVAAVLQQRKSPTCVRAGLQVVQGQASQTFTPLRDIQLTIGRNPHCALFLPDPQVSAQHASIQRWSSGYVLTDMNSRNGTFVNGQRVQQVLLQGGERVKMGTTEMIFTTSTYQLDLTSSGTPAQNRTMACLAVMVGDQEFARYPIESGTVLGRYAACPVNLSADALVSRQHARLDCQNGQWMITNLSTSNGTTVNGHPITCQALQQGNEIRVGNTILRFIQ